MNKLLIAATMVFAGAAQAENLVNGSNAQALFQLIKDEGYVVELKKTNGGEPMITGKLNGSTYSIYFFGCDQPQGCNSIQFHTGYNLKDGMTMDSVNTWHRDKRFAKVFLDENNDPYLQMDVNTDFGVSSENFLDTFDYWTLLMSDFENHINWR